MCYSEFKPSDKNQRIMNYALSLARKGYQDVLTNPPVGAVLYKDNSIIGTGYHDRFGGDHAERMALSMLDFSSTVGSDLYVTLEPCNHWGKTPPCTERIIEAGVKRVFFAVSDPNPAASGGAEFLKSKGVEAYKLARQNKQEKFLKPWKDFVLSRKKTLEVFCVMSLNGLIYTKNICDNNLSEFEKNNIIKIYQNLLRNVQKEVKSTSDILSENSYHFLINLFETLGSLTLLSLKHSINLHILRVPIWAVSNADWEIWDSDIKLKRLGNKKFNSFILESYSVLS